VDTSGEAGHEDMSAERMLAFDRGVAAGADGVAAARAAGYGGTARVLSVTVARLRKHPLVAAELERIENAARGASIARRRELLEFLTSQLRFRPSVLLNDDGTVDLALAKACGAVDLLDGLDVVETVEGEGNVTRRVRIRFPDRQAAGALLAKLRGWNKAEKHDVKVSGLAGQLAALSDEQVEKLAAKVGMKSGRRATA
jgi:hypothetical protein